MRIPVTARAWRQFRLISLRGGLVLLLAVGVAAAADREPAPPPQGKAAVTLEEAVTPLFQEAAQPASAPDLQALKQDRFRELKRQIEELSRQRKNSDSQHSPPAESAASEKPLMPMTAAPQLSAQPAAAPEDNTTPLAPVPDMLPEVSLGTHPAAISLPGGSPATEGGVPLSQKSVEGPIDRFALATSLFGTGEFEVCLQVLQETDRSVLPRPDQVWAQYLEAGCHRKCGRIEEAKVVYRRILAEKDADWVGVLARWWLDNLEEKARLQADVARLTETLTAWEKEIETLAKRPD